MNHQLKTTFSILLIFLFSAVSAQVILSDLQQHQTHEADSMYTVNYGWKSVLRKNDGFIAVWDNDMDWVQEHFNDGAIYYIKKQPDGSWTETPIYPETRVTRDHGPPWGAITQQMHFGNSFDATNNMLVAGAAFFREYNGATASKIGGAVFTFEQDDAGNWKETSVLMDSVQFENDNFGRKVVLANNQLFVFSAYKNNNVVRRGNVTVYDHKNGAWHKAQLIEPNENGAYHEWFGFNMAADDNHLVVFSSRAKGDTLQPWVADNTMWLYEFDQTDHIWKFQQRIIDTTRYSIPQESAIKFYNNELYVGDFTDDGTTSDLSPIPREGVINIFKLDQQNKWAFSQRIKPSRRYPHLFGYTFHKHNNMLFVSAHQHEYDVNNAKKKKGAGAFYVFKKNENNLWEEQEKVVAPDRDTSQSFGILSGHQNQLLITAPDRSRTRSYRNPVYPFQTLYKYGTSVFYTMQYDTVVNSFNDFKIFPNPSSTQLTIELDAFVTQATVQIISLQGQVVASFKIENQNTATFNLSTLAAGVYVIRVVQPNKLMSKKLMKL